MEMEPDLLVKGLEQVGAGEWAAEAVEVGWAVTVLVQGQEASVSVPVVEPRFRIKQVLPVIQ